MANPKAPVKEGYIPFTHDGETFQTYYKVFGDLATATRTPLVVLHGGPGLVHNYLLAFSDLTVTTGIPVILYDQLGNGRSTHLRDKPLAFWTVDLFADELANVLRFLRIDGAFDLTGHSWGGILAAEFTVRRQPPGLKHLVLTDSLASFALWIQATLQLLTAFPEDVQEGIKIGMKDPDRYYAALKKFHAVHGCTVKPTPAEMTYSFDMVFAKEGDPTVASAPILQNWSIEDRLRLIHVPTFVMNGRADMAQDFVVAPFFQKIEKVKWVTFEKSSHTPFLEEREHYMQVLADFLSL